MEAPLPSPADVVRPWRTATLIASGFAAVELVLLLGAGAMLLAKPLSRSIRHHALEVATATPTKRGTHQVHPKAPKPAAAPKLARRQTKVLVLNGNGERGVAHSAADRLSRLGYRIAGAANAKRMDYAATVVMYRRGYRAEGLRLARDVHAKVLGPLDGLHASSLRGGQLALILGAS